MLERLNEEIRRRTYVVRISKLTEPPALGQGAGRRKQGKLYGTNRYINIDDLREHKKLALRQAA